MKDNNFHFNQVFLNILDSKQLLSFSHLENISAFISGKSIDFGDNSLSILLAKTSFAFLLISMLSYWFQMSFKSAFASCPEENVPNSYSEGASFTNVKPYSANIFSLQSKGVTSSELRTLKAEIRGKQEGGANALDKKNLLKKVPLVTMWFANITLALLLSIRWIESGHFPLSNLYESLIFLSWSLTSIHLFLENLFYKKEQILGSTPTLTLGAITSPVALFTNAFATFSLPEEMQKVTVLVPALKSNWLIMHVSVMIISYAALLSGSLLAMAFLVVKFIDDNKIPSIVYTFIRGFKESNSISLLTQFIDRRLGKKLNYCNSLTTYSKEIRETTRSLQGVSTTSPSLMTLMPTKLETEGFPSKATGFEETYNAKQEETYRSEPLLLRGSTKETVSLGVSTSNISTLLGSASLTSYPNIEDVSEALPKRVDMLAKQGQDVNVMMEIKNFQFLDLSHILDNLSYRSIGLGFALLTIGILSGAVWANEAWGSYWSWDPKETWAFITWLVFAFYLHTRLSKGWVGKESAFVASFGFVVIWFCYLGVNLFGKGLHSYGWFQQ